MECFVHHENHAVGICKSCGKAVCRRCAIDLTIALACCETCAQEATALHEMNQRGKKIYGIGVPQKLPSGVIMWLLFGLFFGGFGLYQSYHNERIEWFLLIFAALSFVFAYMAYRRTKDIGIQC